MLFIPGTLCAQDYLDTLWLQAQEAYLQQDYETSSALFERIVKSAPSSVHAMYNLGNSYMHQGDLDKAILWYERALRLKPFDSDIRYNLSIANSHRENPVVEIDQFFVFRWIRLASSALSVFQWTLLHLVFLWTSLGICIWSLRKGNWHKGRWIAMVTGVCALITLGLAIERYARISDQSEAVIMGAEAAVSLGPDSKSQVISRISPGEKVMILDSLDNFYKVRLVNLEQGWIPSASIERI